METPKAKAKHATLKASRGESGEGPNSVKAMLALQAANDLVAAAHQTLSGVSVDRAGGSSSLLSHVNFSTPVFKMDLVHQLIDEENTTSLSCINVLPYCGV